MTNDEIKELNRRIAEKVFGYSDRIEASRALSLKTARIWETVFKNSPIFCGNYARHVLRDGTKLHCGRPFQIYYCPPYTDGAFFEQLLAKCAEKCGQVTIIKNPNEWHVFWAQPYWTHAETLPLALCLFAEKLFADPPKPTAKGVDE